MAANAEQDALAARAGELAAMVDEIRARIRSRHPAPDGGSSVALANLMPLLEARDVAEAKVAAIGTVNPRPPGLVNNTVQSVKRIVARALDWHVREQVEFNRAVLGCVQAALDALNEVNRALALVDGARDLRSEWLALRNEWQHRVTANEIQFLRAVSDLQGAFQHRVTLQEETYREQLRARHADYERSLEKAVDEMQRRFWDELAKVRLEYESLIHAELRLVRQKALAAPAAPALPPTHSPAEPALAIDWLKFAECFRGSEADVKQRCARYVPLFQRATGVVLDLGCGRGELLEVLRAAGITARGVDTNAESIALCRAKGLDVLHGDMFAYLSDQPDGSLGGIACIQVVEHLPPGLVLELVRLTQRKLRPGAALAIETPNPESLAIFATHFYIDPTHTRPVPPALLKFYLEEAGFGGIDIERLYPAAESIAAVNALPGEVREQFFGALDYAISASKL